MTQLERKADLKRKYCVLIAGLLIAGFCLGMTSVQGPVEEATEQQSEEMIQWNEDCTEEVSVEPLEDVIVTVPEEQEVEAYTIPTYIDPEHVRYAYEIGEMYGICPELIVSIIEPESGGDPNAVSPNGAIGLMQVVPIWHWDRMERLGVTDLYDPYSNILVGVDYLAELARDYQDLPLVLMCYNEGPLQEVFGKYESGLISEYAQAIMQRSSELQRLKDAGGSY